MCRQMSNGLEKKLAELSTCTAHHDLMLAAHHHFIRLAAEGCSGWVTAIMRFNKRWANKTHQDRDSEGMDIIQAEINRSVFGELSKQEPIQQGYCPDDTCMDNVTALHNVDDFHVNVDENDPVPDSGDDDFGPVIRQTPMNPTDPGKYGRADEDNARHFVDIYGDNLKYITVRKSWVLWDGECWHKDGSEELLPTAAFRVVRARQTAHANKLPRGDTVAIKKANAAIKWAERSGMK